MQTLTNLWLAQLQFHYHAYKYSLLTVCISATKGITGFVLWTIVL